MKTLKNYFAIATVISLLCLILAIPAAVSEASPVFNTRSVSFSSSMKSSMSATTSIVCAKISVTSVTLEKSSGGAWGFDKNLPCPSPMTNTDIYGAGMDYSSYCVKGNTYRIVVVFNADGVTASATSPGATY